MFASPFFTSGRASILPVIATHEELHTANSLTQTTAWTSVALGSFLGGAIASWFGFDVAFIFNALSFLFSAVFIGRLRAPGGNGFSAVAPPIEHRRRHPLQDYIDGLRYMRSVPLLFGLALVGVGWASGGGAAQILFSLFGEVVFNRGAAGIGEVWGCAGVGLISAASFANTLGPAARLRALQVARRALLRDPRRQLHPFQPEPQLRAGAGLHRPLAPRPSPSATCST